MQYKIPLVFAPQVENGYTVISPTDLDNVYTDADARWDELLASDEGQLALDKLADEALAEIRAGIAKPMIFRL